jgi:hypothetical protein
MRTALQYSEVINDLFRSIEEFQSECDNPAPDLALRKSYRDDIFRFYAEIKNMSKGCSTKG